jgi:hypothetical protein
MRRLQHQGKWVALVALLCALTSHRQCLICRDHLKFSINIRSAPLLTSLL